MDVLDLYDRGTAWCATKFPETSTPLDAPTPCEEWDVRALMNHMFDAQTYFIARARGEEVTPTSGMPPDILGDAPRSQYVAQRDEAMSVFSEPGVVDQSGVLIGIGFVDQLIHGWDLAVATKQKADMPDDLAQVAFSLVDGRLTDEQRKTAFKPAVAVPDDARAQDRLLGYSGRRP